MYYLREWILKAKRRSRKSSVSVNYFSFPREKLSNSSENLLFLFPKKFKLTKNKTIDQEKNLVQRKHQEQVKHRINESLPSPSFYAKKIQNRVFDEKNSKSSTRKYYQNHHDLEEAV